MHFDLLLQGGTVVDGTGAPRYVADVGVTGDRVAAVGNLDGAVAGARVDATGKVVAPGFIDVHVHSEWHRLSGEDPFSGLLQGVTTELMSPDGFSWAPLHGSRLEEVLDYLQVFYGPAPRAFTGGAPDDLLALFRGRIRSNLVPQIPHLPIRVAAMGWDARPAVQDEIDRMKAHVRAWLAVGARAFATGQEYQPTAFADTNELIQLCQLVAEADGLYVTHQRGYWDLVERGLGETFSVGRGARIPVHVSHLAVDETAARLIEAAEANGIDFSFDMYPYAASCTHLLARLPEWAQAGGPAQVRARLANAQTRRRIADEMRPRLGQSGPMTLASVEGAPGYEGQLLQELAAGKGQDLANYVVDLLAEQDGRAVVVYHWPATRDAEGILRRTARHPRFIGASDGVFTGSHPHPRGFGTFARIVGNWVQEGILTLEAAVHRVAGYPAARFGLHQRGVLRPGAYADIAVFDPAAFSDRASFAAGRTSPAGMEWVFVNGVPAVADGKPTGALAGRVVG